MATVSTPEALIDTTEDITYVVRVRVRGVDNSVIPSGWVVGTHTVIGKSEAPSNPTAFISSIGPLRGVVLDMEEHTDADFLEFIITENGTEIYRGNSTQFVRGFIGVGTYDYVLSVRDRSGNLSAGTLTEQVSVNLPSPPSASTAFQGENYVLSVTPSASQYSVIGYRLTQGATTIAEFTGSTFSSRVDWIGSQGFELVALYPSGIETAPALIDVDPVAPGTPTISAQTIDHLVSLSYQAPANSLPIGRYDIYIGDTFGAATLHDSVAGNSNSLLIQFESDGQRTIWIVAVDTALNEGLPGVVSVSPTAPPDFVLFNRFEARPTGFVGTKSNSYVDSSGGLIMLVDPNETWDQYTANGYATFQEEHNAGHTLWLLPGTNSATYQEVYDAGAELASAVVSVNAVLETLAGSPSHAIDIGYSADNVTYTTISGVTQAFATNFRYVRVTVTTTGDGNDLGILSTLNTSLSLKSQSEDGMTAANAGDTSGTFIPFDRSWIDITSIAITPLNNENARYRITGLGIPSPPGFYIHMFNEVGARITQDFTWRVQGYLSNN